MSKHLDLYINSWITLKSLGDTLQSVLDDLVKIQNSLIEAKKDETDDLVIKNLTEINNNLEDIITILLFSKLVSSEPVQSKAIVQAMKNMLDMSYPLEQLG